MDRYRTYRADAVVLKRTAIGEADRVVMLFTKEKGLLSAVAKGSRKPTSKLAAATEILTYGRYFLAVGRNLDIITQADIKQAFIGIKSDTSKVAHGAYLLELTSALLGERQPNPEMFDTLLSALYIMESGTAPELAARYFELQAVDLAGYRPELEKCVRCGGKINKSEITFSPSLGGCVCAECGLPPGDGISIQAETADVMQDLLTADAAKLKQMKPAAETLNEIAKIMRWHIRYRLDKDLNSIRMIDVLKSQDQDPSGTG